MNLPIKLFQEVRDAFDELAAIHAQSHEIQREMNLKKSNSEDCTVLNERFHALQREWDVLFVKYVDAQSRFTAEMRVLRF